MLKKLWRYVWGEPEPDTTLEMLRIIVENQEKSQTMMMGAVQSVIAAGERQAEVLGKYLDLFKSPGEPTSWTEQSPEEEGSAQMVKMGFDSTWPEDKQAEWVLKNIDRL